MKTTPKTTPGQATAEPAVPAAISAAEAYREALYADAAETVRRAGCGFVEVWEGRALRWVETLPRVKDRVPGVLCVSCDGMEVWESVRYRRRGPLASATQWRRVK